MNAADGRITQVVSGFGPGWYQAPPPGNEETNPAGWKVYNRLVNYYAGRANYIEITHYNGTRTQYVHMRDVWFTKADIGKHVNRGQGLGTVGTSGLSSGCHLHLTFIEANGNIRSFEEIMEGSLDQKVSSINRFLNNNTTSYHLFQDDRDNFKQYGSCGVTYREVKWAELNDLSTTWRSGYAFFSPAVNSTIFVKNSILNEYLGISGPCGVLGHPMYSHGWVNGKHYPNHYSETEALPSTWGTTGWYQQFQNGQIYWNAADNDTYHVYGKIYEVYQATGGTWGTYGFPKSDPYQKNGEMCQDFEGGEMCESNAIDLLIYDKETRLGGGTRDGVIHNWCGTKVLDFHNIAGHGDSIIMVNPNNNNAYLITGAIWETYRKHGSCDTFGYPKEDERTFTYKHTDDRGKSREVNAATQLFSKDTAIISGPEGTYYLEDTFFDVYIKYALNNHIGQPISNNDMATSSMWNSGILSELCWRNDLLFSIW